MTVLMAAFVAVQAQHETGTWTLTPRVGVNLSTLSDQLYLNFNERAQTVKAKYKWGLTAGVDAEYQAGPQVAVSGGVFYSNEGFTYGKLADVGELSETLHFVNIPILLHFYIEPNLLPGLALKAGVQLGYLAKATRHEDGTAYDATDDYHRVNVSIPAGISYTYCNLTADFRYNIGVANLCKVPDTDWSWRTGSFWFTVGYHFVL